MAATTSSDRVMAKWPIGGYYFGRQSQSVTLRVVDGAAEVVGEGESPPGALCWPKIGIGVFWESMCANYLKLLNFAMAS